jgi:hypothetical protein
MRRLLILGVAAATALLSVAATAAPALAGQHKPKVLINSCTDAGTVYLSVMAKGTNFYLGTPNKITSTSVTILKPAQNGTTLWTVCAAASGSVQFIQKHGGKWYAATSRSVAVGADVPLETVTNNGSTGTAFASQLWIVGSTTLTLQNQSTKLYLRVRNSGPKMYQSVTTGLSAEVWTVS